MSRPLRIEYEGAFYHVTSRGNGRRKIFISKTDYVKFLSYIENSLKKYGIPLHAYALMGNIIAPLWLKEEPLTATISLRKRKRLYSGTWFRAMTLRSDTRNLLKARLRKRPENLFQGFMEAWSPEENNLSKSRCSMGKTYRVRIFRTEEPFHPRCPAWTRYFPDISLFYLL